MDPKEKTFNQLAAKLNRKEEDIKDFHFMVERFKIIGTELYDSGDEVFETDEKWKKISDVFRGFGYSSRKFSGSKCKGKFYQWSSFYAKNYDILNGKLKRELQEIFDLLKIVHILDLSKLWVYNNSTHSLLRQIATKTEIKNYLINWEKRRLELENEQKNLAQSNKLTDELTQASSFNCNSDGMIQTFEDMNLSDDLLSGIHAIGYTKPSFIQQRAIVPFIKGKDVIAQAQSGTGKTAAFAIAILQRIDLSLNRCQALILAPTRELAQQIHKELFNLGKYMKVKCHTSIGGYYSKKEKKKLRIGMHIVVGTPGRVLDMMQREALLIDRIKMFVLDESDQLLDLNGIFCRNTKRGFQNQIFNIYKRLSPSTQVFLSSATMPNEVLQMSQRFMKSPVCILVKDQELTLEGLQQFYVKTGQDGHKYSIFLDLYQRIRKVEAFESSKIQAFVYCNTRKRVELLAQFLESQGITMAHMHGAMTQSERQWILNDFRENWSRFLITTDLLGRGIDVKEVEIVINYDLNDNLYTYIHRVGRSGRFGRVGKAINLVTDDQMDKLKEIQKFYNTQIDELPANISSLF